ncbi:hypothetical protein O181_017149 [Austropuccinia psidii MF-1]|uniref:Integrase catalytic domain-containing protein n=1 Tax=Austropuccinia psidii MF-1 TaxID=1389203 RepID=A0A9Q3C2Z0_9BASI|nr:hypothetical protein [Austropuccinia psidii MF-1]
MDLPPSSYHDSLEELWDEEEEPEEVGTMMNVVPSVYHQYLDVFSKVKAEKLPPHCACDHHIELEGSLPPVGLIYSLSNQESGTLRAYISENLEKGLIWPSSSSTGAPVLKNKYPVPPMNPLPTVFNGSSIFSKIDLPGAYKLLKIKEGDEHLTAFRTKYGTTLLDALSRWDKVYLERGEDFISKNPIIFQQLIKEDEVQPSSFLQSRWNAFQIQLIQFRINYGKTLSTHILQELGKGISVQDYSLDSSFQRLLFKDWVVVPNEPTIQLIILQKRHDYPLAGHPGQKKTLKLVKWDFHWSRMTQFIKYYVSSCQQCSRSKNIHHKKFGLIKPLPIPTGPCICLSMDFITQLPLSNSFDSILVIVDRFSKMVVFITTMSSIPSLDLAHLFIKNTFSKNGLPSSIVSDRGSPFVFSFLTNLCQQLKISRDLETDYQAETDGQTERVNQILEQHLQIYVSYHQDDWNTWIPLAGFAYNNCDYSSTKQ